MRSRPSHQLSGLILPYGEFDLSLSLPSSSSFTKPSMANTPALERFNNAYLLSVSSLHEDLRSLATSTGKSLPPALFLCGTEDALLDYTLLMGTKWMIAGEEAIVKIQLGAPHAFTTFAGLSVAEEALDVAVRLVRDKLETVE